MKYGNISQKLKQMRLQPIQSDNYTITSILSCYYSPCLLNFITEKL